MTDFSWRAQGRPWSFRAFLTPATTITLVSGRTATLVQLYSPCCEAPMGPWGDCLTCTAAGRAVDHGTAGTFSLIAYGKPGVTPPDRTEAFSDYLQSTVFAGHDPLEAVLRSQEIATPTAWLVYQLHLQAPAIERARRKSQEGRWRNSQTRQNAVTAARLNQAQQALWKSFREERSIPSWVVPPREKAS